MEVNSFTITDKRRSYFIVCSNDARARRVRGNLISTTGAFHVISTSNNVFVAHDSQPITLKGIGNLAH
jgi:hypothetical protein